MSEQDKGSRLAARRGRGVPSRARRALFLLLVGDHRPGAQSRSRGEKSRAAKQDLPARQKWLLWKLSDRRSCLLRRELSSGWQKSWSGRSSGQCLLKLRDESARRRRALCWLLGESA